MIVPLTVAMSGAGALAGDIQIIVLSCRNRAFRDLGGQKLTFTEAGAV